MEKSKILEEVYNLIEKDGCYQEVMNVVNVGWAKYKGKIDEQLSAIELLADDLIDKRKASEMLKNEHTAGHINLSMFPVFREKIIKISKNKS